MPGRGQRGGERAARSPGWRAPSSRPRAQRSDKPNPARQTATSKLPVLKLIFKVELIAGAANAVAGAGDVHSVGGVTVTVEAMAGLPMSCDVQGEAVKLTGVLVAMVLGGMA